jgi:hypothetical protein
MTVAMTKREARRHKAEWDKAIHEGRVVRWGEGLHFEAFKTAEEAQAAVEQIGEDAAIVMASVSR